MASEILKETPAAGGKLEGGEECGGDDQPEHKSDQREGVGDDRGHLRGAFHLLFTLIGRQPFEASLRLGLRLHLGFHDFAEADLLARGVNEDGGDYDHQQEWRPPRGIAAQVGKGF